MRSCVRQVFDWHWNWLPDLFLLLEPPPLPRSAPPPLPPPAQTLESVSVKKKEPQFLINYTELEKVVTRLYPQGKQKYLSYHNVPWTLNLRKEVRNHHCGVLMPFYSLLISRLSHWIWFWLNAFLNWSNVIELKKKELSFNSAITYWDIFFSFWLRGWGLWANEYLLSNKC